MKIAVCLFGHIGQEKTWKDGVTESQYDQTGVYSLSSSLIEPLREALSKHEVHFFVHSWSASSAEHILKTTSFSGAVFETPKRFTLFFQVWNHFVRSRGWVNPALFIYNLYSSYPQSKRLYWLRRINAGLSRWFSTKQSLRLVELFEKDNSIRFDHIISARLDLIFTKKLMEVDLIQGKNLVLANFNSTPSKVAQTDRSNNTFNKKKCSDLIFSGPRERIMRLQKISDSPTCFPISPHRSSFDVLFQSKDDFDEVTFTLYPWYDFGTFKSVYTDWTID